MIEVDRLSKRFGPVTAVDDLSFTVRPGRVTGFLGPNGAGKTTTMRVILGLDAPTSGRALVAGRRYDALIAGFVAGGVIAAAVWIFLALACRRGHGWARITGTVLFGIVTLDTAVGLFVPLAAAVKFWGVLVWLIGLVAVVLLWRRESGAYFRQAPA